MQCSWRHCSSISKPIKMIQRFKFRPSLEEYVAFESPWKPGTTVICCMTTGWDAKDEVKFFKCTLPANWLELLSELLEEWAVLCLREQEEYQNKCDHVQAGVETKC